MRKTLTPVAVGLAVVLAAPALARDGEIEAGVSVQRMLRAIQLPLTSGEARRAGVAEDDIRSLLGLARQRSLPPDEVELVLREEVRSARRHGPIDGFGAFVQDRLDDGLRGRALASAIRDEHLRRSRGAAGGKAEKRNAKAEEDAGHRDRGPRRVGEDRSGKHKVKRNTDKKMGQDR